MSKNQTAMKLSNQAWMQRQDKDSASTEIVIDKLKQSKAIARKTAEFLAKGGKVEIVGCGLFSTVEEYIASKRA